MTFVLGMLTGAAIVLVSVVVGAAINQAGHDRNDTIDI